MSSTSAMSFLLMTTSYQSASKLASQICEERTLKYLGLCYFQTTDLKLSTFTGLKTITFFLFSSKSTSYPENCPIWLWKVKTFSFLVQLNSSTEFHYFIADSKKEFSMFKFLYSRSYTATSGFWHIIPISWLECKEENLNLILVLTVLEGKLSLDQAHGETADQSTILSTYICSRTRSRGNIYCCT